MGGCSITSTDRMVLVHIVHIIPPFIYTESYILGCEYTIVAQMVSLQIAFDAEQCQDDQLVIP